MCECVHECKSSEGNFGSPGARDRSGLLIWVLGIGTESSVRAESNINPSAISLASCFTPFLIYLHTCAWVLSHVVSFHYVVSWGLELGYRYIGYVCVLPICMFVYHVCLHVCSKYWILILLFCF